MMLYKYVKINEHTTQLLTKGEIYFSHPSEFNDPFDCDIPLTTKCTEKNLLKFMRNKNITRKFLLDLRKQYRDYLDMNGNDLSKLWKVIQESKPETDLVLDSLKNLNRVFCLSASFKKILMWSHYAENHKGICIGFNFPNIDKDGNPYFFDEIIKTDEENKNNLIYENKNKKMDKIFSGKVNYDKPFINKKLIYELDDSNNEIANYNKFKDWDYEEEYRFITNTNFQKGILDPKYITKIYFGCNTSELDIYTTIQKIIKSNFLDLGNLKFYIMEKSGSSFQLKEKQIDIKDFSVFKIF